MRKRLRSCKRKKNFWISSFVLSGKTRDESRSSKKKGELRRSCRSSAEFTKRSRESSKTNRDKFSRRDRKSSTAESNC